MRRALVVGGANGIGLAIATFLAQEKEYDKVYIVDRAPIAPEYMCNKFEHIAFDLRNDDYSLFDRFSDIDTLMITAGFGRLAHFTDIDEKHIVDSFSVNTTAVIRIIHHFYDRLLAHDNFYCGIMGSIAGFISSPLFSVYGASKAALKIFIESVNIELEMAGSLNRILNVAPGTIKGTAFYNGDNDLSLTTVLAEEIVAHLEARSDLYIPLYDEIYREVLERYHDDFRAEGRHSYIYKIESGRVK
ncbi:MAG: SDR family oxidoreductase [Alistipes sp.]|nr:SDR family oxidoreductase [Alistipes sp.]